MMLRLIRSLSILLCFFALNVQAARTTFTPLPPDEAFPLAVKFHGEKVTATWHIAPGYYLYVKKMKVEFKPPVAVDVQMPSGNWQQHKILGRFLAYTGNVTLDVTIPDNLHQSSMAISYQGCAESGFCYPPFTKRFAVDAVAKTITPVADASIVQPSISSFKTLMTDQEGVRAILAHQNPAILLLVFFGLGLLLAFTPCVLPMIPILTSIIVGQKHAPGTRKAFLLSFTYVMGVAITYALAGTVAASLGSSLQVWLQQPTTIIAVSSLFMLLALSLFGLYELRFSRRWHNKIATWSDSHEGGTYLGVFCMGLLSTLVVSPCVTAPLVGVLIYIGQTGNLAFGALALFTMGIGMGVPLLLLGMSAGKWLPKSGAWMKAVKEFFGIFMVAMAIWLLSRILSSATTHLLFGLLLVGTALYIGLYLPHLIKFRKLNQTLGVLIGIAGIIMSLHAFQTTSFSAETKDHFVVVQNASELKDQLLKAKASNQPVLLDFYADWCDSCVLMDQQVFAKQQVKQELNKFLLLRVDLSQNSATDREFLKDFNVIAPPTVLFFDQQGKELNHYRIVGDVSAEEFLSRLQEFKTASCEQAELKTC